MFMDFVMLFYNDVMFFRDVINDDAIDKEIEALKQNYFKNCSDEGIIHGRGMSLPWMMFSSKNYIF